MPPARWQLVRGGPARTGAPHDTALDARLVASGLGDAAAFAEVYDRVAPRIYGLVRRLLPDADACDAVVHAVFLEIWRTSCRFDPRKGSAGSWLMATAHRIAVDGVRGSARGGPDRPRGVARPPVDEVDPPAPGPALDVRRLQAALETLGPAQRQALDLAYFGGCTYDEVARVLQVSPGTAGARLRDGLVHVRDHLSPMAT